MWRAFDFLRDADANRFVVVGVAIVVGVGGVFFALLGDEPGSRLRSPAGSARACAPTCSSGPPLVILAVFLVYPVINTIIISFKDAHGQECVGLDNYRFVFTDESMLARDAQHRSDGSSWCRSFGGERSVWCSRRSPTGCVAARRSRSR